MTGRFIGREHELEQLRGLRDRKIAGLVVIKGRRCNCVKAYTKPDQKLCFMTSCFPRTGFVEEPPKVLVQFSSVRTFF